MRKLISILVALGFVIGLAGCNTVKGFGKDVSAGGEAVQKGAEKAKPY